MVCRNSLQLNVCLSSEERYSLHSLHVYAVYRHSEIVMLFHASNLNGETVVQLNWKGGCEMFNE